MVHASALILIENPQRNRNVSGIEQFTRQNDNSLYFVVLYKFLTNGNGIFITEGTICKQETSNTFVCLKFGKHVENPCVVGIALGRSAIISPVHSLLSNIFGEPMFEIERRICHDVIKNKSGMLIFIESRNRTITQMVGYTTHS